MKSFKQLRIDITEAVEKRYCPKCEKVETRSECKYGVEYWDQYATKNFSESIKKDYDGPLYAPWSKVVAGKKAFQDKDINRN